MRRHHIEKYPMSVGRLERYELTHSNATIFGDFADRSNGKQHGSFCGYEASELRGAATSFLRP